MIKMTAFDKAWGIVKADPSWYDTVKPYYGSMKDIDFCDMCVGGFDGGPYYERVKPEDPMRDKTIICALCAEGLLEDKPLEPEEPGWPFGRERSNWISADDDIGTPDGGREEHNLQTRYGKDPPDTEACVTCGHEMAEGYYSWDWYCSRRCLGLSDEEFREAYETDNVFWTTVGDN